VSSNLPRSYAYPHWTWRHRWLRRPVVRLSALGVALGLVGAAVIASPGAAVDGGCVTRAVGCDSRMALGLATEGMPRTTQALESLEQDLGRTADVALTFTAFRFAFDGPRLRDLALAGRIPMITWEPWDPTVPEQDRYPLDTIAAGASDPYLKAQAQRIREIGRPVAVRFAHEMNADWYPWGAGVNGNTPADYVAAYRHVHDVFEAEGVRNVTWVWSPASVDTPYAPDLADFYPGDDYVDWVGLSAYFDEETDTWANAVAPTVRQLAEVAPQAPLYLTETGVLPGPNRAEMIHDLLRNLLRTPGAIGFTWFDVDSRHDWRIDDDPAALDAVREELASAWYNEGLPGPVPLAQIDPSVDGTPSVGSVLTASSGTWRGATSVAGQWLTCAGTMLPSCSPTGDSAPSMTVGAQHAGLSVRYEVTATGPGGITILASTPSSPVLAAPARPAPPTVESHPSALRVVFPDAPDGATHWQLRVDGREMQLVPVGTQDYWVTELVTATSSQLSLTAQAVSATHTVESDATTGTATPMSRAYAPYVLVTGTDARFTLPQSPAGADEWVLTVDGVESRVPLGTSTTTVPMSSGSEHTWSLAAAAGSWGPLADGSRTVPTTGTVTPIGTPPLPEITPGPGSLTFTLPAAPAGASGWRISVGPTLYPELAVGTTTFVVDGLYPGYPATWTLRAVSSSARSEVVTGRAAALPVTG